VYLPIDVLCVEQPIAFKDEPVESTFAIAIVVMAGNPFI